MKRPLFIIYTLFFLSPFVQAQQEQRGTDAGSSRTARESYRDSMRTEIKYTRDSMLKQREAVTTARRELLDSMKTEIKYTRDSMLKQREAVRGSWGIVQIRKKETKGQVRKVFIQVGMLDLAFNNIHDRTNYKSPETQHFLDMDPVQKNANLFRLNQGKSLAVNIYPVMVNLRLVKTRNQKLYLSSGVGLQVYNFRFTKPISYINEAEPKVILDQVSFSKNKLSLNYLQVPLLLTFKSRIATDTWLVYGIGITGGYRLSSWTKQVSSERGKQKNHDPFNFSNFNSCITAEIGIDSYVRLFGGTQITPLHTEALEQYPYFIGFRFLGI